MRVFVGGIRATIRSAGAVGLLAVASFVVDPLDTARAQTEADPAGTLSGALNEAPAFVVERYRARAAQGDPKAQFYLGYLHERRLIRTERPAEEMAAEWYGLAAEGGHAAAQYKRATMAEVGKGAPRDLTLAVRLYRAAAQQGLREAQFNLALLLESKPDFAENPDESRYWYERAAYQGLVPAMLALGRLYGSGTDGEPDMIESWAWLTLAEETEADPTGQTRAALDLIDARLDVAGRRAAETLLKAYRQLQPRRGNETHGLESIPQTGTDEN